jgi:hypothetical protein
MSYIIVDFHLFDSVILLLRAVRKKRAERNNLAVLIKRRKLPIGGYTEIVDSNILFNNIIHVYT